MCDLDLSKTLIFDFYYKYIKKNYDNRAEHLFTDTHSFAYKIKMDDFYEDISGDVEKMFNTSNFPKHHPFSIKTGLNKKVIGMFKDEAGGKIIKFVGLRAKLYSYKMFESREQKKCKGMKKAVIRKNIMHNNFKTCL